MAAAQETSSKRSPPSAAKGGGILSPTFRSAAAMAGWDEEALLLASLVVDDTPVRESRHKKRPRMLTAKSPPSTKSNRRRRLKRQDPDSIPAVVLCLDDGDEVEAEKDPDVLKKKEAEDVVDDKEKNTKEEEDAAGDRERKGEESGKGLPCMDRLREELSCAICLEICFEPSTTPCGHSFCMKCLKCAAAKCGKRCPKCRQLISNGRSCTINTVLWNTIQLLFPEEVDARKNAAAAAAVNSRNRSPEEGRRIEPRGSGSMASRNTRTSSSSSFVSAAQVSAAATSTQRRGWPSQFEDAALALRLQREEFMGTSQEEEEEEPRRTLHSARANLRALASRAYHIRTRGRY